LCSDDNGVFAFGDRSGKARAMFVFIGNDAPSPQDDDWSLIIKSPDDWRTVIGLQCA
jgi:hypothetical protein